MPDWLILNTTKFKACCSPSLNIGFVYFVTCFIQNKVNLIFNVKLYQGHLITESWLMWNRANSNSLEYSNPALRVLGGGGGGLPQELMAASTGPLITTDQYWVKQSRHMISDLSPPPSAVMNRSASIFSAVLLYFKHLYPSNSNNGVKG